MCANVASSYSFDETICCSYECAKVTPINELYVPQTNGEISSSIMQNWTQQAVECYEVNCECAKCSLSTGNYSFICQMPKIVKALLKTYGPPENSVQE